MENDSLLDTGESVKKWMDNFFLNQVFGSFCLNVLADIFAKFFCLLCGHIAFLCCWRARKEKDELTNLQIQKLFYSSESLEKYIRSDSFYRRVSNSTSAELASASGKQPESSTILPPTEQCQKGKGEASSVPVLLKSRNGFVHDRALDLSSADQSSTSQTASTVADPQMGCDNVVIDIPAIFVFADPEASTVKGQTGDLFKPLVKEKVGVSCGQDVYSSRILQAMVPATDENLVALRELAVEGMKLDNGFSLQIGRSFLYCCDGNPEEPVLLRLRDVEVPTVLQADYSAGVLTIRGKHLEGAEIRAATSDGYMILTCSQQDQIDNNIAPERRIEVWRCTDLLPPVNLDQVKICASKKVRIDGRDVTVRSEVASIQNITLRTVIRSWVPTIILVLFLASQALDLLTSLLNLVVDPPHQTWLLYPVLALAVYTIQLLPPSLEDSIKDFVELFKLAVLSVQVLPDIFTAPAFFMRNGYCFRRGAKYLVDGRVIFGGPHQKGCDAKEQGELSSSSEEDLDLQGKTPHSSLHDDISSESRDWKWTCFTRDKKGIKRVNPDSKERLQEEEEDMRGFMDPFTVRYSSTSIIKKWDNGYPVQYIPEDTTVKLYSKHLQAVTKQLLSDKLQLYETYGEIKAKYLLVSYIRQDLERASDALLALNHDENEGECLDMFHLIRFLRKEYAEIFTQYERMKDAGVASFDMLWTLIWPKADVVYYCSVTRQELFGKVFSTKYDYKAPSNLMDRKKRYEFSIELEAYDYDSEKLSFEVKGVSCAISSFQEEVEIHKLNVCPVQFKTNPDMVEEFFLRRGRRYFDLALKYERRFMHYQGRLYMPFTNSSLSTMRRRGYLEKYEEEENIDGRVMIDKRVWMKKKKDDAELSARRRLGVGPPLETGPVMDESNPLLKYAPAIVHGYSFSRRMYGCFAIDRFSDIEFVSTAFDTLVMDEDMKSLLLAQTKHYIQHPQAKENSLTNVDPLPNKGKGCIILLHGVSGTGKTFTVESLAEKLECPLWQLSVSTTSSTEDLESDLHRTFEIAASWRAILMLDEADVYLTSRKYSEFSSEVTGTNARTGVFLRVLEYYTGILFLTTNLINAIEPAIHSRMSLSVRYVDLSIRDRKQLWINFLNRIDFQHPSGEFWVEVLHKRFNGREIRNIIQNAQILAHSTRSPLSEAHLLKAFRVMATSYTTSHVTECEEEPGPNQTSTTMSNDAPSVVTE